MKRTLSLRSETLAQLTADELGELAGGAEASGTSCPVLLCKISLHPHCPSGMTCPTE